MTFTYGNRGNDDYPFQAGSSPSAAGINYGILQQARALARLLEQEKVTKPNN